MSGYLLLLFSVLPWTCIGLVSGISAPLPTIWIQIMLTLLVGGLLWSDPLNDLAGCGTIMTSILWGRCTFQFIWKVFMSMCPAHKPPPWRNRAPCQLEGKVYGYSLWKYRIKDKSGHARPKNGGPLQPFTLPTPTLWLSRTPFSTALGAVICYWAVSIALCLALRLGTRQSRDESKVEDEQPVSADHDDITLPAKDESNPEDEQPESADHDDINVPAKEESQPHSRCSTGPKTL